MVLETKSASSKVKGKAAPSVEPAAKIKSAGTKKATVVKGAPVEGAAKKNASSSSGKAPAKKAATSPAKGQKKNAPVKVSPVPQATAEPKRIGRSQERIHKTGRYRLLQQNPPQRSTV